MLPGWTRRAATTAEQVSGDEADGDDSEDLGACGESPPEWREALGACGETPLAVRQ